MVSSTCATSGYAYGDLDADQDYLQYVITKAADVRRSKVVVRLHSQQW